MWRKEWNYEPSKSSVRTRARSEQAMGVQSNTEQLLLTAGE
jgi:hypothetical protein